MALFCSKKLLASLRGITSKHLGDFYCLNCLRSFTKENKRESQKRVSQNFEKPSEDIKILVFNQYQKSNKASFIIYEGLDCLIKKLMDVKIILKIHPQKNK